MESRLTQKYEFRDIRPEEAEEAIEIEHKMLSVPSRPFFGK